MAWTQGWARALESPRVCVTAHFSQQEFVPGLDRRGEESWLLQAEHMRPLVPFLLPRSRGETAETALALASPPPARSCPICQGPRCPLQVSRHRSCPRSPAAPGGCGLTGAAARCRRRSPWDAGQMLQESPRLRVPPWGRERSGTLLGVPSQVPLRDQAMPLPSKVTSPSGEGPGGTWQGTGDPSP